MPKTMLVCIACAMLAGCNLLASFNGPFDHEVAFERAPAGAPLEPARPEAAPTYNGPVRATLRIDGKRGNPDVLFFLALSGGGSRAAYFSASTMLKLQTVMDVDLLAEVDVMSSVSGGSLAAAHYAASRDDSLTFGAVLRQSVPTVTREPARTTERLRLWRDKDVRDLMTRDYLIRSSLNWFWPSNIVAYWLTSYDRSDIMAQTLEDNLYDTPILGEALTFADLNPQRPYLILNATSATEQLKPDDYSFGSVFTFTDDDFRERLGSNIREFSIARAVQASAAFPLVYANVTLRDFRRNEDVDCKDGYAHRNDDLCDPPYLHVFDGGNSDNLGLRSIKRTLFELRTSGQLARYDKVVVLLVDAFTKPKGARRSDFDPRTFIGKLIDPNVSDAVDSLLQANRSMLIGEFRQARLGWSNDCGVASVRHLPPELCDRLNEQRDTEVLDLTNKLVFYHFSFEAAPPELKRILDQIPTSFGIEEAHVNAIDRLVDGVLTRSNPCLVRLAAIVRDSKLPTADARAACTGQPSPAAARETGGRGEAATPETK